MNLFKGVGMVCLFQLLFLCSVFGQSYSFSYSSGCIQAINAIHELHIQKARTILSAEAAKNPHNVAIDYLQNCADYYELIFTGDKNRMQQLEKAKSSRISRLQKLSATSIRASYAEAEVNLHWSILKLMQQEYVGGALELRTAYQLHQKNFIAHPEFSPTYKSLGFIKAILGTLPSNYHWMLNIIGLTGDFNDGIKLIESYLAIQNQSQEYKLANQQADFYYILLHFYFGNKTKAQNYALQQTTDYSENFMSCYIRAFITSRCARNDEAISILLKRPKSDDLIKTSNLDFLMGYAKLNKLDTDADIEFKKVVTFSKDKSLKKDAYRRLSWLALIQHDSLRYITYRNLAFSVSSHKDDEDIAIDKDFANHILPNTTILKARLLFDGGYYAKAADMLEHIAYTELPNTAQQAEYCYRYARIMQEQKKYAKAIEYFTLSIKLAEPQNLYFAPYSALNLGYIYTRLGYTQTAAFYFNKAIAYKNYKSQGYITQKSQQALSENQQ